MPVDQLLPREVTPYYRRSFYCLVASLLFILVQASQVQTFTGFDRTPPPAAVATSFFHRESLRSSRLNSAPVDQQEGQSSPFGSRNSAMTQTEGNGRKIVDRSTLTLLEHININVPSQEYILPFYYKVLGCGMDPRKASNLKPDAPKKTLWANCGASQFHLPYGDVAQLIPGKIGLRYDSIDELKHRLKEYGSECVKESKVMKDERTGTEYLQVQDMYGNVFWCRPGGNPVSNAALKQPYLSQSDAETWADGVAKDYGVDATDCKGIDFVEFMCPMGTADKIALFYESVLDATTSVVENGSDGSKIAIIGFGNIDDEGKTDQSILFRETSEEIPPYDGHHVAMYIGESKEDFEKAFQNCVVANVVWVNPRFSDKARDLQGARKWKQFRFKDIINMKTGEKVFELEHEMRSIEHEAWPGGQ